MTLDGIESLGQLFASISSFLKTRALRLSKSGFKTAGMGKHAIDSTTGFWENPPYSQSKPPRWLVQVFVDDGEIRAALPQGHSSINIGMSNTAQGDVAALACRIQPLVKTGPSAFIAPEDAEVDAIFVFKGALAKGSSADAFHFVPATGQLTRVLDGNPPAVYIYAALLGLRPLDDVLTTVGDVDVTYGAVLEALQDLIHRETADGAEPIPFFDLTDSRAVAEIISRVEDAWQTTHVDPSSVAAPEPSADYDEEPSPIGLAPLHVPVNPKLLGINDSVYRQINAALRSGKQHLMLYGPPGTGKTTLAQWIAENLPGSEWTLVTGSADWSSQDVIGGYQPVGGGNIGFVPGVLLREFDRPLIIDELNRCDIDKVLGPLFTVLSGQATTLPYREDIGNPGSETYTILPVPKPSPAPHEFAPGPAWRLITTINSIDRASLYQMSYALSRRFAWIFVDAPTDLRGFITDFLLDRSEDNSVLACPLADAWAAINTVRSIGPAPIIDVINYMLFLAPEMNFFGPPTVDAQVAFVEALDMALLPMLDGISPSESEQIADSLILAFALQGSDADRVASRLRSAAI